MENSDMCPLYHQVITLIQEIYVQFIAFLLSSVYQLTCEILCLHAKKTNARNSTAKKYELCDLIHFHLAIRHFVSEYNQG